MRIVYTYECIEPSAQRGICLFHGKNNKSFFFKSTKMIGNFLPEGEANRRIKSTYHCYNFYHRTVQVFWVTLACLVPVERLSVEAEGAWAPSICSSSAWKYFRNITRTLDRITARLLWTHFSLLCIKLIVVSRVLCIKFTMTANYKGLTTSFSETDPEN